MHPAYSVILFTTASGAGYGLLALLGLVGINHGQASSLAFGLVSMVIALGLMTARRAPRGPAGSAAPTARPPMPWFVLGFVGLVIVNSLVTVPPAPHRLLVGLTTFLLSVALAAMGLETDIRKLAAKGLRPALLGLAAFLFIAAFSLALVKFAG